MDPRHARRIYTVQKLFEEHFPLASTKTQPVDIDGYYGIDQLDEDMLKQAREDLKGVESHIEEIDRTIEELAPEWPLNQVVRTDLEILRLGIYEGFIIKRVPPRVAINEAIELAREFGGENSRKFVSGVLGTLYEKQEKVKL